MRQKCLTAAAAAIVAGLAFPNMAGAAPFAADGQPAAGLTTLQVQTDCHSNVRRHRLPGVGVVDHYHRGRRCDAVVVEVEDEDDDCHANAQAHPLPGYGRRPILHQHRGSSCRVVILEDEEDEDCHAEPERHSVPGYGRVWHRHIGRSCRVEILRERSGGSGPGCVRIGPVTVCP